MTDNTKEKAFFFQEKNIIGLLILAILGLCAWHNSIITLKYIEILRWPGLILFCVIYKLDNLFNFLKECGFRISTRYGSMETMTPLPNQNMNTQRLQITEEQLNGILQNATDNLQYKDIQLFFERIYNQIYKGQFDILESLLVSNNFRSFNDVANFYEKLKNSTPELQQVGWDTKNYLHFLISHGLINLDHIDQNVYITEIGKTFINYINSIYGTNKPIKPF